MVIDIIDWLTCRSDSWTSWTITWTNGYSIQQDRDFSEDSKRRNIPGETMFQDMYASVLLQHPKKSTSIKGWKHFPEICVGGFLTHQNFRLSQVLKAKTRMFTLDQHCTWEKSSKFPLLFLPGKINNKHTVFWWSWGSRVTGQWRIPIQESARFFSIRGLAGWLKTSGLLRVLESLCQLQSDSLKSSILLIEEIRHQMGCKRKTCK